MRIVRFLACGIVAASLAACASSDPAPEPEPSGTVDAYKSFDVLSADGQAAVEALMEDGRIVLTGFNFATDSDTLTEQAKLGLARLGPALLGFPGVTANIAIVGHTDNIGDHDYNMALSERRAEAIRDALLAYGVQKERLVAVGLGPMAPIDKNATASGRAENRRVELWVVN